MVRIWKRETGNGGETERGNPQGGGRRRGVRDRLSRKEKKGGRSNKERRDTTIDREQLNTPLLSMERRDENR
uniref:Uncharacterized protein n=1 Tax=Pristionchus pacificus TaxID=54126 RepID=A0A2A6CGB0_PRIPA|eukprot:PDM77117.1 hypothetical protein PRIPAC_43029 [Pristionchus pacificus]